ncbi:hepatocyte growth factor receptor-like protein, partial [Dinothrombium tinctorium]
CQILFQVIVFENKAMAQKFYLRLFRYLALFALKLCIYITFANTEVKEIENMAIVDLYTPVFKLHFFDSKNDDLTNETDQLLVGARNYIFKLSTDLKILGSFKTNPIQDNQNCYPGIKSSCPEPFSEVNNDNKILLVKPEQKIHPFFIACGTAYQGMCFVVKIQDLKGGFFGAPSNVSNFIATRKSTVAFFSKVEHVNTPVLYIGAQYDNRPMHLRAPLISSRLISAENKIPIFHYASNIEGAVTKLDLNPKYDDYDFEFVYGFEIGRFVYFLTRQQMGQSGLKETKLARICKADTSFFSYMEIPLTCDVEDDDPYENVYSYATSAFFLNKEEDSIPDLFVTFVSQKDKQKTGTKRSAICVYNILELNKEYDRVISNCMNGKSEAKLLTIFHGEPRSCTPASNEFNDIYKFCGSGLNPYMGGTRNFQQKKFKHFANEHLTSIAVTFQNQETVVIAGTIRGKIIKLKKKIITNSKIIGHELINITLSNSNPNSDSMIQPDPVFDTTDNFLYLATGTQVVKFPVGSCSLYTDCQSCITSEDPLECGWCGSFCAHRKECTGIMSSTECAPELFHFKPLKGPIAGGTVIEIKGSNFGFNGTTEENSNLTIIVAGVKCDVVLWLKDRVKCKTRRVDHPREGKVVVHVSDVSREHGPFDINGKAVSQSNFSFLIPTVTDIHPKFGPMSGGTAITIKGKNLNIGSKQIIKLGGINCTEVRENSQFGLNCKSGPNSKSDKYSKLIVEIDDDIISSNLSFAYRPNPTLTKIDDLKTIAKGGTNVTVVGTNLDSVSNPTMIVTVISGHKADRTELVSKCIVSLNGTLMTCLTPHLPHHLQSTQSDAPIRSSVTFSMDGSPEFNKIEPFNLFYYPNPRFTINSQTVEVKLKDPIQLLGENLSDSYKVSIELKNSEAVVKKCIPEGATGFKLFCKVDETDEDSLLSDDWDIFVNVAGDVYQVGKVHFVRPSGANVAAILTSILFLLLLLCLFVVFILKRKGIYPFVKKNINYQVAYRSDGQFPPASPFARQGSQNEYIGTCAARDRAANDPLLSATTSQAFVAEETMALLAAENILIAREYLTLGKPVGKGCFGCVYKGELRLPGKEEAIEVAVKTLHNAKGSTQNIDYESFLQEGLMMKDFKHENVLSLIGVCFDANQSPMVILPFMANGDLLTYVRCDENIVTIKDLILFGVQVAEGMNYLASCKFVHRDLAARNCMIDKNKNVKVADFGLSRDIYEKDYYSSDHMKTKLPVKWMAPESLEKGTYNTKTDVWSYGVLLWELMTRGVTPYPEVDNWDILNYLKQGFRMLRPEFCPELLYQIMLRCWDENPKRRPTFAMLVVEVKDVITKLEAHSSQQKVGLNVQYVNYPPSKYYNMTEAEKAAKAENSKEDESKSTS